MPAAAERWKAGNIADPVVLFLARLHPRKRVLAFVEMARILRDQGVPGRYRIVGSDGGDAARAERMVRKYGLEDSVKIIGSLSSTAVPREYTNCAVYVLPAVNEPFPMTVLEALSRGVPTVVTETCFIAPMLEKHGAAVISSPRPEALARSVRQILCDQGLAGRLSSAAVRLVQEELTVDRVTERLEHYYRRGVYAQAH